MSRFTDKVTDLVTDYTLHAGRLRRYNTWAVHHEQTVGEHCWQVARIYEAIFGPASGAVERFIRHHDTAELIVGDPPFPIKKDNPDLKEIYNRLEAEAVPVLGIQGFDNIPVTEKEKVKICDLIEMMEFGMVEVEMGNRLAVRIVTRTLTAALKMAHELLDNSDLENVKAYINNQKSRHAAVFLAADDYRGEMEKPE